MNYVLNACLDVCACCVNVFSGILIYCFTLQSTAFPTENFFKVKYEVREQRYCRSDYCKIKIHGQHRSYIPYSIIHEVVYIIYIWNFRGEEEKRRLCLMHIVLFLCCLCVTVLARVCVCVFVAHRRPIHHILFTVFLCESFACHYSFVL